MPSPARRMTKPTEPRGSSEISRVGKVPSSVVSDRGRIAPALPPVPPSRVSSVLSCVMQRTEACAGRPVHSCAPALTAGGSQRRRPGTRPDRRQLLRLVGNAESLCMTQDNDDTGVTAAPLPDNARRALALMENPPGDQGVIPRRFERVGAVPRGRGLATARVAVQQAGPSASSVGLRGPPSHPPSPGAGSPGRS